MKINFPKTASNKHVDLKKLENFVTGKYYPEDILKDMGQRANFKKSCKYCKIVDGRPTSKGKRMVILDNDRKHLILQYQSILPYLLILIYGV